jgi:hypothetical protein
MQDSTAAVVKQTTDAVTSLAPVFLAVIGILARFVVIGLKAASAKIRALPEWQQTMIAALVACGLTVARHYIPGLELPADVDSYTVDAVSAIGSTVFAGVMAKRSNTKAATKAASAPSAS